MRFTTGLALAGLLLTVPGSASAQDAKDSSVKTIDAAGERAATRGAPGTVVPDSPGVAVAPGIQAPVETPVKPSTPPEKPAPAAK